MKRENPELRPSPPPTECPPDNEAWIIAGSIIISLVGIGVILLALDICWCRP